MDDILKDCFICGSQNSSVYTCGDCCYQCCQLCISSHKNNDICKLISDHLLNISHECKDHGNKYSALCLNCSERTCKECRVRHARHTVIRNSEAVIKVKDTFKSRRIYLSEQEQKIDGLIQDFPSKINQLKNTNKSLKTHDTSSTKITADLHKLYNECDKLTEYQTRLQKTIAELGALEKIQYKWTFIPAWVSIARNLSEFDQHKVTSPFPQRKTFFTELEDPTSMSEGFGVIQTTRSQDQSAKLENEVLRLEAEVEELIKTKSTDSWLLRVKKRLEDENEQLVILNKVLALEKSEMHSTIEKLYRSALDKQSQESLEATDFKVDENSIPEMVEFAMNQMSELHQSLTMFKNQIFSEENMIQTQVKEYNKNTREFQQYVNQLEKERDNINGEYTKVYRELDDLKNRSANTFRDEKPQTEEITKAHEEIIKLQQQSNQLEIERDRITKDYQTVCKERDELKASRNTLYEEIRSKEEMIKANDATNYGELKKLQNIIEQLKSKKDKMAEENHKICKEKEELKHCISTLKDEIRLKEETIKSNGLTNNEEIKKLQYKTEQLKTEKDNILKEYNKLYREMNELKNCDKQIFKDGIRSTAEVTKACDETHNDEISKLQQQSNQLEVEKERIRKDYQTVCKERDVLKASINTLKEEMRLKEEMIKTNGATNYEELEKLQNQIEQLKTEKDRMIEENHKICKDRDELKEWRQSIQMVFDENEKSYENKKRSLEEKEREHHSKQQKFSNQLNEKDNEITDLYRMVNNQKRLLSEKEEAIRVINKEKDDLQARQQSLKHQLSQKDNTISELNRMHTHHKGIISDHEETIRVMKREKDDLQTRLSSVAGEKLTKGNPSITDLGDPNRPMKIGEKYGELYDNEWTDAMENIKNVKEYYPDMKDNEIEEIIIRHLQRLLKCCYGECLWKAEDQIQTLGKALVETMCLTFESKEEIESLPVCKEASVLRRTKSEDFAKFLVENKVLCNKTTDDWDYINKNKNVMQILMESTFFEKCVYLCWCMAIQDPVMYLDDDPIPCTPIDKNTYKEFVKSGDSVAYVVWPALFLHKGGPLLYKGVVQAYWKKDDDDNMEGTSV